MLASPYGFRSTRVTHHLGYSDDIIVATADESDQRLPGILSQNSDSGEFGSLLLEVEVGRRPLLVQFSQVRLEVQVMPDEVLGIISLQFFAVR